MYNSEFPLQDDIIYLNHAAVAPWPACTTQAVTRFAEENSQQGAKGYLNWIKAENELREHLRWLINAASVDDIALQKSTSEALSTIANGIDWKAGDNVVIFQQEFPSNRIVWQMLKRFGVECRLVDIDAEEEPETALLSCCDEHTRLISVSSVQYASGLRMDLKRLSDYCVDKGVLFCVDAIQSLGALPFDLTQIPADFVVADGHKWMLGPEGVALLYVNPELRNSLTIHQFGWHMIESAGDYDSLDTRPATTAKRFECGSPNMLGVHALNSSLSLIREIGMEVISDLVLQNTAYLIELINRRTQLRLVSRTDKQRLSGIVTFQVKGTDHAPLYSALMQQGVICAPRGGGIRFSPHFYTEKEKLQGAFQILDQILLDSQH
ncbi:MAG: aminotransferase class V-fold PLP-dependent enzyme [Sedimenticola sp.]|nr:aminotransferase class V-fold PLP-dependent enzyme [Sedimenticola sp.]